MIEVYGYSDDILVMNGAPYPADEIGCFDSTVEVRFSDGTLIKAGYPKEKAAIWWIKVLEKGTAPQTLTECDDEDAEIYSDVFEIDADYVWHEVAESGGDYNLQNVLLSDIDKATECFKEMLDKGYFEDKELSDEEIQAMLKALVDADKEQ